MHDLIRLFLFVVSIARSLFNDEGASIRKVGNAAILFSHLTIDFDRPVGRACGRGFAVVPNSKSFAGALSSVDAVVQIRLRAARRSRSGSSVLWFTISLGLIPVLRSALGGQCGLFFLPTSRLCRWVDEWMVARVC